MIAYWIAAEMEDVKEIWSHVNHQTVDFVILNAMETVLVEMHFSFVTVLQ